MEKTEKFLATGLGSVLLILMFLLPLTALAASGESLAKADALFNKGGIENIKNSIPLYVQAAKENPNSYEANWKCARAYREYADRYHKKGLEGWKGVCAKYGKIGMSYGEKAIAINPDGVEGNFFYGACVGIYSDGVSVLTALREGLKGKTQKAFEKAYKANKNYEDGAPMIALGRFWSVLPWPLRNRGLAVKYLLENINAFPKGKHIAETEVYLGEVLVDMNKDSKAKVFLKKAANSSDSYYSKEAKRILKKIE
ncbi:hypothetical protein J7J23_01520 [bacterium]|nr:hypothetical protein [bacterium]